MDLVQVVPNSSMSLPATVVIQWNIRSIDNYTKNQIKKNTINVINDHSNYYIHLEKSHL